MPTTAQGTDIVDKVRHRLADAEREGIHLKVTRESLDDEWLYIVVSPARPGVRASDHAQIVSRIEREPRAAGDDNVLLVPVLED